MPPERGSPTLGLRPISLETMTRVSSSRPRWCKSSSRAAKGRSNSGSRRSFRQLKLLPCVSQPPPLLQSLSSSLSPFQNTVTNGTPASTSRRANSIDVELIPGPYLSRTAWGSARRSKAALVLPAVSSEKALS